MCVVLVGCSSVNSASAFSFDIFSFHSPASNPATAAADDHGFDAFQSEPAAPVPHVERGAQTFWQLLLLAHQQRLSRSGLMHLGGISNAMGNMATTKNEFGNMNMEQ
jgi:hypothetical protein